MRDTKLVALVALVAILHAGHTTDHIVRGDLRWPLTLDSLPFIGLALTVYAVILGGLYLYSRNRVGPGFWAILAGGGAAFGWLAHFSPFTDQPPRHILGAYGSAAAGWLALAVLVALMAVLLVATVYAGYLWRRSP